MNKYIIYPAYLFLVVWLLSCGSTQKAVTNTQETLPHTVLWQIQSDELARPSYLMGTIHIIPEEMYFWPAHFQSAMDATSQVVLETNELDMDPASMMGILPRLMLPDGKSISDFMSNDDYSSVKDYFDELGLPLQFLKNIKPFFLYMLIDIDFGTIFSDGIKSYEMEITNKAKQDNKPILGLETLDSQIAIFDSVPYQEQADLLVQSIEQKTNEKENPEQQTQLDKLYKSYIDQDLNAMLTEMEATDVSIRKYNKLFLDHRNRAWIPAIEKFIRDKPTFIAVGAAHLPGEVGVIKLLQNAGYTMIPIMIKGNGSN